LQGAGAAKFSVSSDFAWGLIAKESSSELLTIANAKVGLWDGRSVRDELDLFARTLTYGGEVGNRNCYHQYGRDRDYFDDNLRDSA
jgi:hypothetical protein